MNTPTRQEAIEAMAIALCEKDFGKGSCNIQSNKGTEQDCEKCECYPAKYAEIALDAFLALWPECKVVQAIGMQALPNRNEVYYQQLLALRKSYA